MQLTKLPNSASTPVSRFKVVIERLLGWGYLVWGHLIVVERGHMVGIFSMGVVTFEITLGWII